jgi:hypothetical protein
MRFSPTTIQTIKPVSSSAEVGAPDAFQPAEARGAHGSARMADAAVFDWICTELEARTSLDRLEARGTVRLALKEAGLEARTVTADQMKVVLERVLPKELVARGIEDAESVCAGLAPGLASLEARPGVETPDTVFARLGDS